VIPNAGYTASREAFADSCPDATPTFVISALALKETAALGL
jgi:hypothetical protein